MIQKPGFYVSNRIEQVGFRVFFPNGYGISVIFGPDCGSDEVSVRKSVKDHSNPEDLPQIISWAMNR